MGKLQHSEKNQTVPNIVGVSPTLLIIFEDARARACAPGPCDTDAFILGFCKPAEKTKRAVLQRSSNCVALTPPTLFRGYSVVQQDYGLQCLAAKRLNFLLGVL